MWGLYVYIDFYFFYENDLPTVPLQATDQIEFVIKEHSNCICNLDTTHKTQPLITSNKFKKQKIITNCTLTFDPC